MKYYNYSILFLLIFSLASLQACTMAKISGKSSKPLLLNNPNVETEIVRSIDETKLKTFDYTGSIDVYEVVRDIVANSEGDAITNITVKLKSDPATFFINVFTLGIANAYKVDVTGDIVTLPRGISSVNPVDENKLHIRPSEGSKVTTINVNGFVTR